MKKQLAKAIAAARAGERNNARQQLQKLLKAKPRGRELTETLYWLSLLSPDAAEKRHYLEQILHHDPRHERAQQQLNKLPTSESASPATPDVRQCPTCGGPLYFAGDGRSLTCERCGYQRQNAAAPAPNRIRELEVAVRFAQQLSRDLDRSAPFQQNLRLWLATGLGAVKEKKEDEAYEYLSRVVQARHATDEERIEAWLGLSDTCEGEEKRLCLENVLAINPREQRARKALAIMAGRISREEQFDPEQTASAPGKAEAAAVRQMSCPRCGGQMSYTPDRQALTCGFCHYGEDLQAQAKLSRGEIAERDFLAAMFSARGHRQPVAMRTFQCQSCAVEFILVPEMLSLTCPYCDSAYVTDAAATQDLIPPDALVPPALNQDQAGQQLKQWFQQHKMARSRLLHLTGVYLPAWTFAIHGHIAWSYETLEYAGGDLDEKFGPNEGGLKWIKKEDSILVAEDNYLVVASHKWPEALQKWVHEFDLTALVPYDPRYLANWPAERYQITLSDASIKARRALIAPIKNRYTPSTNFYLVPNNGLTVDGYKLILLPLWLGHYELESRRYAVMVNGQNGVVRGLRPQGILSTFFSWLTGE